MRRPLMGILSVVWLLVGCGTSPTEAAQTTAPVNATSTGASSNSTVAPTVLQPPTPPISIPRPSIPAPSVPTPELPNPTIEAPELPNPLFPGVVLFEVPGLTGLGVTAAMDETTTVFTIDAEVLFDFDQFELRSDARSALEGILAVIIDRDLAGPILVAGHTDSIGSAAYNQALSEQRAATVAEWFADGIDPPSDVTAVGYGEGHPVAANTKTDGSDDPQGRQMNRRVEIAVSS